MKKNSAQKQSESKVTRLTPGRPRPEQVLRRLMESAAKKGHLTSQARFQHFSETYFRHTYKGLKAHLALRPDPEAAFRALRQEVLEADLTLPPNRLETPSQGLQAVPELISALPAAEFSAAARPPTRGGLSLQCWSQLEALERALATLLEDVIMDPLPAKTLENNARQYRRELFKHLSSLANENGPAELTRARFLARLLEGVDPAGGLRGLILGNLKRYPAELLVRFAGLIAPDLRS